MDSSAGLLQRQATITVQSESPFNDGPLFVAELEHPCIEDCIDPFLLGTLCGFGIMSRRQGIECCALIVGIAGADRDALV